MAEIHPDDQTHGARTELHVAIGGMHCVNCPALIESRFRSLPQVETVKVLYPSGRARIVTKGSLGIEELQKAVERDGYTVTLAAAGSEPARRGQTPRDFLEIAGVFVVLIAVGLALQHFHLLPQGFGISDQMSYGLVFLIGLVASVSSCLAVTGGLMVALAAEYNQANQNLGDRERLIPLLYFNTGRLLSYTVLGGIIGAIGSALTLSAPVTGLL